MSNYPNEYNIKTATGKLNNFDLSKTVITTHDFGYIMPIECKMLVPGDKFNVNLSSFTRLMPLPCPTYGHIQMVNRAFFVPFRYLVNQFNDIVSNNKSVQNGTLISNELPHFTFRGLLTALQSSAFSVPGTELKYDLCVRDGSTTNRRVYNTAGRRVVSFLTNLGFPIYEDYTLTSNNGIKKISILPILAYWKFYFDWIVPARYLFQFINELNLLRNLKTLYDSDLIALLNVPPAFVDDDFFTSAFQSPSGYENPVHSITNLVDPNDAIYPGDYPVVSHSVNSIPYGNTGAETQVDSNHSLDRFTIKSIGALQDMINRGKLAGTKVQDYLIAEYGLRPSDDALLLSKYLGSFRSDIQIGDVTSQSDTRTSDGDGAYLGEFGGKALGSSNGHFQFETEEHGMLIFTTELKVKQSYVQGVRPEFKILSRYDLFQPELDNLTVEPIEHEQLHTGMFGSGGVFGFTPSYSKLKTNFDTLSGDFIIRTSGGGQNGSLSSWYLSRYIHVNELEDIFVNKDFQSADNYGNGRNYDRIFQQSNGDHFYTIFKFDIKASRPMQSISDALETEETNKMGHDVKIDLQHTMH